MRLERSIHLSCTAQRCLAEVQTTRLLLHVARPLLDFSPVAPAVLPTYWQERQYLLRVRLFGVLPLGRQWVNISGRDRSHEGRGFHVEVRDNGYGTLARRWDHRISILETAEGCQYTDRVDVNAGILTPLVYAFAWLFYRHRQRRWQHLVRDDFVYGTPPG